jgi:hypothetical protein
MHFTSLYHLFLQVIVMSKALKIHASFAMSSSCLCFGDLHNIRAGALEPLQEEFPNVQPQLSGTIKCPADKVQHSGPE